MAKLLHRQQYRLLLDDHKHSKFKSPAKCNSHSVNCSPLPLKYLIYLLVLCFSSQLVNSQGGEGKHTRNVCIVLNCFSKAN